MGVFPVHAYDLVWYLGTWKGKRKICANFLFKLRMPNQRIGTEGK